MLTHTTPPVPNSPPTTLLSHLLTHHPAQSVNNVFKRADVVLLRSQFHRSFDPLVHSRFLQVSCRDETINGMRGLPFPAIQKVLIG